jgi:predicted DNA-binding transcriptional regulator AlpA
MSDFITIKEACRIIGGDKPISPSTYYRAVKAGRLPAPEHLTAGIVRVRLSALTEALNAKGAA